MKRYRKTVIWMILLCAGFTCCLAVVPEDSNGRDGSSLVDTFSKQFTNKVNSPEQDTISQKGSRITRYAERNLLRFDKSSLFITILYVVILYSIITLITLPAADAGQSGGSRLLNLIISNQITNQLHMRLTHVERSKFRPMWMINPKWSCCKREKGN